MLCHFDGCLGRLFFVAVSLSIATMLLDCTAALLCIAAVWCSYVELVVEFTFILPVVTSFRADLANNARGHWA